MRAGLRAFEKRGAKRSGIYSYEAQPMAFDTATRRALAGNKAAFAFFDGQPPGYKKLMTAWVMSAKKDETRSRRLARLIEVSAPHKRIDFLKPRG